MPGELNNTHQTEPFLPVAASIAEDCQPTGYELLDQRDPVALKLSTALGRGIHCEQGLGRLAVVRWSNPLDSSFEDIPPYPDELRSFHPALPALSEATDQALQIVRDYGPLIPYARDRYREGLLRAVETRNDRAVSYQVPDHQGRGFIYPQIYSFRVGDRVVHKLTAATKGNGITGYWHAKKQEELTDALLTGQQDMPTNPDVFHARDHTGQSRGQKKGDEIVWVGLASNHVTAREVAGFDTMAQSGVFTPLCLPVERLDQLPLGTGEVIDTARFKDKFDTEAGLVYLAKTWGNETRVWGNVITRNYNMTAAHLLSFRNGDKLEFEHVIDDLRDSAGHRKLKIDQERQQTRRILDTLDPQEWGSVLGYAGEVLAEYSRSVGKETVVNNVQLSEIMSLNALHNVINAGANRLYGKPVAWHLENVGLWGEVSGGERIYGQATDAPQPMEFHSLFAYMFDSYTATTLSKKLNVTNGAVTGIVARLGEKHLIYKQARKDDLRKMEIHANYQRILAGAADYQKIGNAYQDLLQTYTIEELKVILDYSRRTLRLTKQQAAEVDREL